MATTKTISLSAEALLYLRTVLETAEGYESVLEAVAEAFPEDEDGEQVGNLSSEIWTAIAE